MLKRNFDPRKPYRAVAYLRMSSDKQNPRSPDQQLAEIERRVEALRYPWRIVGVYRDEGVPGTLVKRRPGLQKMLGDIRSRVAKTDLILVDTSERLGRTDDVQSIRKDLFNQDGVLVLSADNNFADPTTPQGRALAMFEGMRGVEENRIKAHQVLRGKRDLVELGFWPGGFRPFGYQLVRKVSCNNGVEREEGKLLEPYEPEAWIIRMLFDRAKETRDGQTRLVKFLNDHPDIPESLKPFNGSTVGRWLDSETYRGELVWAKVCTGVIDDVRRKERNSEDDIQRKPEFCKPLVDDSLWHEVQAIRQLRRERLARQRRRPADDKLIAPAAAGLRLNYLLSGLARCAVCNCSLRPIVSGAKPCRRKYVYYACPRAIDGYCINRRYFREKWLRENVVAIVCRRLGLPTKRPSSNEFAETDGDELHSQAWFIQLFDEVRQELGRLRGRREDARPALLEEKRALEAQNRGWLMTLGNAELDLVVRRQLEEAMRAAGDRMRTIEEILCREELREERLDIALDVSEVASRVGRLSEVLADNDPTRGNIELSLHVDRIDCFPDGRAIVRICRLGAFVAARELLHQGDESAAPSDLDAAATSLRCEARARARRRVDDLNDSSLLAAAYWAQASDRFAGLDPKWFVEDEIEPVRYQSWAEQNAEAVGAKRAEGLTVEALAAHFQVTPPTIRKALRFAAERDASLRLLPRKMPRQSWRDEHADEVFRLYLAGAKMEDLAKRFGKAVETVRLAIVAAKRKALVAEGNAA